jgi:hypothetical protein
LLIRNVTHYPVWSWTLRYTANVSNQFNLLTDANSGVGSIYSTAQASGEVPAGRLRSTIQSIATPAADSHTTWGWLKIGLTEVQSAHNRVDVSAEYILGAHANYIYL